MIDIATEKLEGRVCGEFLSGSRTSMTGVVVLGGSSGRVDVDRARLFAEAGTTALALQWFGGAGQAPGICEIPLETFLAATDRLMSIGCRRIVFVGTSKGAEAALLVASLDPRISAVVAVNPSSVVWGNIGPGRDGIAWPERSSWCFAGRPLAFVPFIPGSAPAYRDGLIAYRGLFEHCLMHFQDERTEIPIEQAAADILIIAGGDDAVWPSERFAQDLSRRRQRHGKSVSLVFDAEAGHRILFPGERTPRSATRAHGGGDEVDARLGRAAWQQVLALL